MSAQDRTTLKSYFNNGDKPEGEDFEDLIDSFQLVNEALTNPTINVGSDATGDIYYRNSSGLLTRLPIGTSSQVLIGGTNPSYASIATALGFTPLDKNGDTMTGLLILSGDPSSAQGAATKNYVDNLISGLNWKQTVVAATTANITLSGTSSVDGISLVAGDRILVKNQTTASENGIYIVDSSTWSRATDNDSGTEIASTAVVCKGGTTNESTLWYCSNTSITLGSTSISFVKIAGVSTYTNGTGLNLSGNTFSIDSSVATLTGTQTLTNKTLTSPKVNLGSDATGDMYYRDASGNFVRLPIGASDKVLKGGSTPSYDTINSILGYTPLNVGGDTMTGLLVLSGDPSAALGAATKNYVDNLVTGLTWKQSVAAATTANITLSGTFTLDGVSLSVGDRVLVKNQTTGSQNGIYVVASGSWSRATDNDSGAEIATTTVLCEGGTANGNTQWSCNNSSVTIGTTAITYVQIAGVGTYTNGTGINLSSNVFSIDNTVVATLTNTQTLTNKTLTSPKINVGSDATGDLYYRDASGNFVRLAIGSSTQVLKGGTVPSFASIASILGYTPVNVAGDTMTGNLILNANPSTGLGAATKNYVDSAVAANIFFSQITRPGQIFNIATEQPFIGIGKTGSTDILSAGFLTLGRVIKISAQGSLTTNSTPTLDIFVRLGGSSGTIIGRMNPKTLNNYSNGRRTWILEMSFTCVGTGTTLTGGAIRGYGSFEILEGGGTPYKFDLPPSAGAFNDVSIDTTVSQQIFLGAKWGTASMSSKFDCDQLIMQYL